MRYTCIYIETRVIKILYSLPTILGNYQIAGICTFVIHKNTFSHDMAQIVLEQKQRLYTNLFNNIKPRCEKTCLRGCRPGPTQTRLYNQKRWLDAGKEFYE